MQCCTRNPIFQQHAALVFVYVCSELLVKLSGDTNFWDWSIRPKDLYCNQSICHVSLSFVSSFFNFERFNIIFNSYTKFYLCNCMYHQHHSCWLYNSCKFVIQAEHCYHISYPSSTMRRCCHYRVGCAGNPKLSLVITVSLVAHYIY